MTHKPQSISKNILNKCPLCSSTNTELYFIDNKNYQHTYYQCNVCNLVFVIPECRLSSKEEKARYDMHHNNASDAHYISFLNRLAEPVLDKLSSINCSSKRLKGLDFGSGSSEAMADIFHNNNYSCSSYDIFYFPEHSLLEQSYDFIVASEVIEHLYDPFTEIYKLWASLNKNGILGIMTNKCVEKHKFANWWYKNDPTHVSLFSDETFKYIANKLSAQIIFNKGSVVILRK